MNAVFRERPMDPPAGSPVSEWADLCDDRKHACLDALLDKSPRRGELLDLIHRELLNVDADLFDQWERVK